jgi:hypothetical protein
LNLKKGFLLFISLVHILYSSLVITLNYENKDLASFSFEKIVLNTCCQESSDDEGCCDQSQCNTSCAAKCCASQQVLLNRTFLTYEVSSSFEISEKQQSKHTFTHPLVFVNNQKLSKSNQNLYNETFQKAFIETKDLCVWRC